MNRRQGKEDAFHDDADSSWGRLRKKSSRGGGVASPHVSATQRQLSPNPSPEWLQKLQMFENPGHSFLLQAVTGLHVSGSVFRLQVDNEES